MTTALTPINLLSRELDLFDTFINRNLRTGSGVHLRNHAGGFPLELLERDNDYVLTADLPGFTADSIDVSLEDGVLTITAKKVHAEIGEGERYLFSERGYGDFVRSITLPKHASGEASARYENGVLTLTILKAEEAKPRKIAIQ